MFNMIIESISLREIELTGRQFTWANTLPNPTCEKLDSDNPQVQGIIVAIPKGESDKYGVSNPQGAKGKINILSIPICHWYESTYTERLLPTRNEK